MTDSLATVSMADAALARADTIPEVAYIHDLAEAARRFARSAEDQNRAAIVKLKAARKGGKLLAATTFKKNQYDDAGDSLSQAFPHLPDTARRKLSQRWQRTPSSDRVKVPGWHLCSRTYRRTLGGTCRSAGSELPVSPTQGSTPTSSR